MKNGHFPQSPSEPTKRERASGMGHLLDGSPAPGHAKALQRIGIACDHGGFDLTKYLAKRLREIGYDVIEFGDRRPDQIDDYPDYVIPLAEAVASGELDRGVAICGSGVGASVAANKVPGVRACLIHECFSAHQGVEDDDMNVICMGGLVVGHSLAWELVQVFLSARFSGADRHCRRLAKIAALEMRPGEPMSFPMISIGLHGNEGGNRGTGS
jgi:ribose 5-phosphate isomerase B